MKQKVAQTETRVGKYELGRTLGRGNFAKVKFARNVETGEGVAIKILHRNKVLRLKMAGQIHKEISTMKLIDHPNVLKIIEVMASKTKIFIVLEYVEGGELFDKIAERGRLEEEEARKYFRQLINAVDYCHSRGVYHRDLKLENLLLDRNGVLKISDFGLSALSQQEGCLLRTACGTPNYVAPEVINTDSYDGRASDTWSCGVILFVLMAGYFPFDDPSTLALYRKISAADFSFPSWFSTGAKNLISRILDPNPLTRIKAPEILEDDWFKEGCKPPGLFGDEEDVKLDDADAMLGDLKDTFVTERRDKPVAMNAFELISQLQNFSLDNMFEMQRELAKKETRFTSNLPANEIMSKLEDAAKPLGFNIHKGNYKMKLEGENIGRKGQLSVATEVFEVAPSWYMVELRKMKGDTLEFRKLYKNITRLKDIVWDSEGCTEQVKAV